MLDLEVNRDQTTFNQFKELIMIFTRGAGTQGPGNEKVAESGSNPQAPREFGVSHSYQGWEYPSGAVVIRALSGINNDLAATAAPLFCRAVADALSSHPLVLDLSALTQKGFTRNVAALFSLPEPFEAASKRGDRVAVCGLSEETRPYVQDLISRGLISEVDSAAAGLAFIEQS